MPENNTRAKRKGRKGFFQTLPGILTAIAGIITALTGLLIAIHPTEHPREGGTPAEQSAQKTEAEPAQPPTLAQQAMPPPAASAQDHGSASPPPEPARDYGGAGPPAQGLKVSYSPDTIAWTNLRASSYIQKATANIEGDKLILVLSVKTVTQDRDLAMSDNRFRIKLGEDQYAPSKSFSTYTPSHSFSNTEIQFAVPGDARNLQLISYDFDDKVQGTVTLQIG